MCKITGMIENVVLQIDLLRNRILKFELILSISSFVVTCGALVSGMMKINLCRLKSYTRRNIWNEPSKSIRIASVLFLHCYDVNACRNGKCFPSINTVCKTRKAFLVQVLRTL